MERLTNKVFDDKGNQQKIYECSSVSDLKIQTKLGEFEDFMEEQGVESLEELKINIEYLKDKIKTDKFNYEQLHKFKNHLQQENLSLKDRWEKLKEYVADNIEITQVCQDPIEQEEYWCLIGAENCYKNLQEKMRELELTDLIRRKEE